MKAVVYRKYGSPDVLHIQDMKKPVPGDHEIIIKTRAVEVTKSDCELRSFRFPVKWFWLPLRIGFGIVKPKNPILGGYFAGEVDSIGDKVTRFKPGDPVFGSCGLRLGAYGEYNCLSESQTVVVKPDNMSFEEAASVPLGGLNALHFLRLGKIQKGERVLINGAGGSIGTFGIQIAKKMGAEVTAVDSPVKEDKLRHLGADHFMDYTREEFTNSGQTWDVILNMVAGSSYSGCLKVLNPGGRYLMANPRLSHMIRSLFTSKLTDKTAVFTFAGEKVEELFALKEMIEEGQIHSSVDCIYSMDQAAAAHKLVETEQRLGCVVLSISQ